MPDDDDELSEEEEEEEEELSEGEEEEAEDEELSEGEGEEEEEEDEELSEVEEESRSSSIRGQKKRKVRVVESARKGVPTEEEILSLAIREQEDSLKKMKKDLKVLQDVYALWNMTEADARKQGLTDADMLMIHAFDAEDAEMIKAVIDKVSAMVDALERDFGQHVRSYEKTVSKMRKILETRIDVINKLDKSTGVFSRYPELSKYIATKQDRLTKAMQGTQKALLDGFATSLARVKVAQGEIDGMIRKQRK